MRYLVRLRWKLPYYLGLSQDGKEHEWLDGKANAKRFSEDEAMKLAHEHGAFVEREERS